jgi:hypothetical protein
MQILCFQINFYFLHTHTHRDKIVLCERPERYIYIDEEERGKRIMRKIKKKVFFL